MPDFKKLTTGEVASKRFTPVRMREGYSTDEVDEFLEAVEQTIEAYDEDIEKLKAAYNELKAKPATPAQDTGALAAIQADLNRTRKALKEAEQARDALMQQLQTMGNQLIEARQAAEDAKANAAASNTIDPSTLDMAGATGIIARMLENAAKNHDDLIAQGESEAMRLRDEAAEEAERIIREAEASVAAKLAEAEAVKSDAFTNLERRQKELERSVYNLETIEKSAREELMKTYRDALSELENSKPITH